MVQCGCEKEGPGISRNTRICPQELRDNETFSQNNKSFCLLESLRNSENEAKLPADVQKGVLVHALDSSAAKANTVTSNFFMF